MIGEILKYSFNKGVKFSSNVGVQSLKGAIGRYVRKFLHVLILLSFVFAFNCTKRYSVLETPVIREGPSFKVGVESFNPLFSDIVKDSFMSDISPIESSCIFFESKKGGKTFVDLPVCQGLLRYQFSVSSFFLYPHPYWDWNVTGNNPFLSVCWDLLLNLRYQGKLSFGNVAFFSSVGGNELRAGFIISSSIGKKIFLPYAAVAISSSSLTYSQWDITTSLGFSKKIDRHCDILIEASYVYSPKYCPVSDNPERGGPLSFPIIALSVDFHP